MISEAPGDQARQALIIGVFCYVFWGLTPALFIVMGHAGASSWEILAHRALWSAPWAGLLVLPSKHRAQVRAVLASPRRLGLLALSAVAISSGWAVFVWSVNNGRNIEASVGYYIAPLLTMAAGALFFRERIDRAGKIAITLAAVGVAIQTGALGHVPVIALFLAVTFCAYGLIRKQIDVDAQTGLFVEALLMAGPSLIYVVWLHQSGGGIFTRTPAATLLMMTAGPATVGPLVLFAWTARRLTFAAFGFLQFISPTIGFLIGLAVGEKLNVMEGVSFLFIWAGAAVFMFGAWRAARAFQPRTVTGKPSEGSWVGRRPETPPR